MDEPKTFREKSGVERSAGRAESAGIPTIFVSHSGTYKRLVIVLRTRRTKAIEDLSGGDLPRLHLFTYFYCHTANMQCLSILVTGSKGLFVLWSHTRLFTLTVHILSQGYKWVPTNC